MIGGGSRFICCSQKVTIYFQPCEALYRVPFLLAYRAIHSQDSKAAASPLPVPCCCLLMVELGTGTAQVVRHMLDVPYMFVTPVAACTTGPGGSRVLPKSSFDLHLQPHLCLPVASLCYQEVFIPEFPLMSKVVWCLFFFFNRSGLFYWFTNLIQLTEN